MRRPGRDDLNFANVVSVFALFVSLGGTSYAVATGSIGSREIANNSVRGKDIRNRTITSRDVRRNGLGGASVKESRLGRVARARNADRLAGAALSEVLQRCPARTRLVADACVETAPRPPAVYAGAEGSCRADFRRLASYQEVIGILAFNDVSLAPGGELTSTVVGTASDALVQLLVVTNVSGSATVVDNRGGNEKSYRCALDPTNSSPGARTPATR